VERSKIVESSFPFHLVAGGFILLLLIIALTSLFWLWMLIDAVRREFDNPGFKILWIAVIFFLHFLGAVVYYFAGRDMGSLPV
jgi:hypothetical protein